MKNRFILTPFFLDNPVPGLASLAGTGWTVLRPDLPRAGLEDRMSVIHRHLADSVAGSAAAGERPVSIAGDCCTAIGVLAGLQRAGIDPFLIWFDAHGDFNTPETTPSGFLGGMPLAMLVGKGDLAMSRAVGAASLPENRVILTDGRDLDPEEARALQVSEICHIPETSALPGAPLPGGPIWVHFDADVVRLEESPAQNYPAVGGPAVETLRRVFESIAATGRLAAVSVSTWNPALDGHKLSESATLSLVRALTGGKRSDV
jgi:arginase